MKDAIGLMIISLGLPRNLTPSWHRFFYGIKIIDCTVWPLIGITRYLLQTPTMEKVFRAFTTEHFVVTKKGNRYLNIFKLEVTKMCFV